MDKCSVHWKERRGNEVSEEPGSLCHSLPFYMGVLGGSDGKESTCNVGDLGSTPRRSSERGQWQPIPVFLPAWSILMDRGARRATVHGVTESDTAAAAAAGAKSL